MIKAIIFDCYGVLYQDGGQILVERCPADRRLALTDLLHAWSRGFIGRAEFLEQAAGLTGVDSTEIIDLLSRPLVRSQAVMSLLLSAKTQGLKVALLSNVGTSQLARLFSTEERAELFDAVVLSGEVGLSKPDRAIYALVATRLGVESEACLMIDDSQINVDGAKAAGMLGVVYETTDQTVSDCEKYNIFC